MSLYLTFCVHCNTFVILQKLQHKLTIITTMDITDFDTVQDSLKDTLKWTCQLIIDNKSIESASPELIDLCQIGEIGSPTVANQDHLPKGASYRFSPLSFPGNEYEKIETTLENASNKGGFKIIRPRSDTKERSKY